MDNIVGMLLSPLCILYGIDPFGWIEDLIFTPPFWLDHWFTRAVAVAAGLCGIYLHLNRPRLRGVARSESPKQKDPVSTPAVDASPTHEFKPPSVLDAFKEDFAHTAARFNTRTYRNDKTGDTFDVIVKTYYDFRAGAKFFGAYIPDVESASSVCKGLADNLDTIMSDMNNVTIEMSEIGSIGSSSSVELPFSGLVYIYSPRRFSLQDLAALDRYYAERNMKVRFRSFDHVFHSLKRRE